MKKQIHYHYILSAIHTKVKAVLFNKNKENKRN